MAALQQSAIAFQAKSPPATRASGKVLAPKTVRLSFSGSISSLRIPKLATKLTGKTRTRGGGGGGAGTKMADSASASYATALADVAKSNGTLEATSADLENIEKIFSEPLVYNYFVNPTVGEEKKREIVDDIVKTSSLQPHVANFLNILVDMKRIELIKEIVKEFEIVYNKITDTELAVVTSVVKLESQHLAQIAKGVQRLTGAKNVRIKTELDPSLIAGFTIRYGSSGSKLIDMSVKKQLADITTQLDFSDISIPV
ncbi:ATP synthase delta chain, chloroplastic-like [Telopea speciosissima]|uniref:ATP synthase delta chain, chloroplastic-like n=1 Tax=Telopea speciosissima TaxID=54955 RepID=UPI001CC7FF3A|nr:ATP synthase delta chain, chloroplastic-like [Telopea speciosissima]